MDKLESEKITWIIIIAFALCGALKNNISDRPYHSSVYSSWQEEEMDELRCDIADLEDILNKSR
jgi:hypothetical protein